MSTYYYGTLVKSKKKEDGQIENTVIQKGIDCNFMKNLLSGWNFVVEGISGLSKEIEDIAKESTKFEYVKYIGKVKKSVFAGDVFRGYERVGKENDIVFHSDNGDERNLLKYLYDNGLNIKEEDLSTYLSMSKEEREEYDNQFYNIYYKFNYYRKGEFFNSSSFYEVEKDLKLKLEKSIERKVKSEVIRSSIEYLKLSDEEKENVDKSLEVDDTEDIEYTLDSAREVRHICSAFSGYDDTVYLYVYADTSEYHEEPEWISLGW